MKRHAYVNLYDGHSSQCGSIFTINYVIKTFVTTKHVGNDNISPQRRHSQQLRAGDDSGVVAQFNSSIWGRVETHNCLILTRSILRLASWSVLASMRLLNKNECHRPMHIRIL